MAHQDFDRLKILSGNANPALAKAIADHIGVPVSDSEVSRFSNGEIKVSIGENVRGRDTFVIQPTCQPANDTLMELLIIIDALRRASARRITAVIPYFGYARQDRKTRGREPITAKLVANLITTAGAGRVLTVDLHAGQIQGFFDIPVDNLSATPIIQEYFEELAPPNPIIVSPDAGGVPRARDLADRMGVPLAIIDKRRPEPGVAEVMNIIGKVQGRTAILIDDIIDTAGTIAHAARALLDRGAQGVYASATHAVFSGPAQERLADAPFEEVVVTDTIPQHDFDLPNLRVLSIAPLIGEAIIRIYEDRSVSTLFT